MTGSLVVWYGQQPVGRLVPSPDRQMAFIYDTDWLAGGRPISCSLPLNETGDFLPPDLRGHHFFANLLPEGGARERLVRQLGVADDDFLLLEKIGGDCAGALQLLPPGSQPETGSDRVQPLDENRILEAIRSGRAQWLTGAEPPRLSLAGAQDKVAVRADATNGRWHFYLPKGGAASTHILKLPVRDLRHVPLYEAYTTFIAGKLGLPVADVHLVGIDTEVVSVSTRYDRAQRDGKVIRLHQEDLCQARGISHAEKYTRTEGVFAALSNLLKEHSIQPAVDLRNLARWQIFNALAGNADGHLKNLSLLAADGGGWQLAPFYDLVCTLAIDHISHQMALPIGSQLDPQNLSRNHWQAFAAELGVSPRLIKRLIGEQAETLRDNAAHWLAEFQSQNGEHPALARVQKILTRQSDMALTDWIQGL